MGWLPALLIVLLIVASSSKVSLASDSHLVQVYVDGAASVVATNSATVSDLLKEQKIEVNDIDRIEPAANSQVVEGMHVNVYRARPYMIVDGDKRFVINSPFRSPHAVARSAGLELFPEDNIFIELNQDIAGESFVGHKLIVNRATPVNLQLDGHKLVMRTHKSTVGEFLKENNITLGEADIVNQPMDQSITANLEIGIVRVGREVVAEEITIPFPTRFVVDYSLPYGERKIEQAGQPGSVITSYEITRHDGTEVSRVIISKTTISQPVAEIVIKGGLIVPTYSSNEQILRALRECETRGNYQANTGNGYYGAYQFMIPTWNRTAQRMNKMEWYEVSPYKAPPDIQDAFVLNNARASSGGFWSQHPGCSKILSLPKFPF